MSGKVKEWVLWSFALGGLFWGCQSETYRHVEGLIYGTYYRVVYRSDRDMDEGVVAQLRRVDASLSMFNDMSVISRLNRGETDRVDSLFAVMFRMAKRVNAETDGAFDITVAPLCNAWGFGYKKGGFPDDAAVDSLLQYVGMEKLRLVEDRLVKENAGVSMDASSIAKGLAVDLAADFLTGRGVRDYLVDIGGEVRAKGLSERQRPWRVGINKPTDNPQLATERMEAVVNLGEGALATSGNYRNYYVREGKKYAHTINPKTGRPVQRDIVSSTVYAPSCMEADAYATAFMVLGLERSVEIVERNAEMEAFFVYERSDTTAVWMSPAFERMTLK